MQTELENSAQVCQGTWDLCDNTWSDTAVQTLLCFAVPTLLVKKGAFLQRDSNKGDF